MKDNMGSKIYFDYNGITVKCSSDCEIGYKETLNGVEYEVVDRELLEKRISEGSDLRKVVSSLITDMVQLFDGSSFNQPIGDWDASNVTSMISMFAGSPFNQPIDNWDVSNVTTMSNMFNVSPFNQPIGKWDVSNVEDMRRMFESSQFDQPINQWCVLKITSEPEDFSTRSPLSTENKPVWGTCPTR